MDGGGNMRSKEEKGAEKQMDEYLKSLGLHRKKIAKDGSCLFRAVAEQVLHCQSLHTQVRAKCVEFLRKNRGSYEAFIEGDFEDYLYKLQDPQQWVGEVEINALAIMYKRDFLIFQEPGRPAVSITANNFKDKVQLCFLNGNHYDCVYPISRIKSTAMCQSIVYELLYDKVFEVDRNSLGVCQRVPRAADHIIDDNMAHCPSSDESDLDSAETQRTENGTSSAASKPRGRGRGRGLLPEKVRRSLNPTLLRNVQYDVWQRSKKAQQKLDYCIAAGMQYSVGDRCQVRVEGRGRSFNATIKELSPNNGPVTVYIEELGTRQVPLWNLRPPNEENSWSTVVREKRVSNGQGDWEDRGRGRGRGKVASLPSNLSQPTAPPGGRMLKQNSWPPQAPVDEREAAKSSSNRKSVSSAESVSFGLTEQQRLAKEEEERNVALVEIQLRDESSFPALGSQAAAQSDGGKKKSTDKRRSQKNTTRTSPVEDVRAPSPSAGDRPTSFSSLLPLSSSNTTSALPAPKPHTAAAPKPSSPSFTSAAAPSSLPSSSSVTKPSPAGSVPLSASLFSFVTPVLPAASAPSSSKPSSSSFVASRPSSSPSPPTFIAPIAPCPVAAQCLLPCLTSSPPVSTTSSSSFSSAADAQPPPPEVSEAKVHTANTSGCSQTEASEPQQNQDQNQVPQNQASVPESQVVPQVQSHPPSAVSHSESVFQSEPSHSPHPPPPSEVPYPSASLQTLAPQPQSEPPVPLSQPDLVLPPPPHAPHFQHVLPPPRPLQHFYQDPLYPGFPQGAEGQVVPPPPLSTSHSGDDLPQDINILRFFFNLGIKAYTMPMLAPYAYLLPLQQAHTLQPRPLSRSPSPLFHHHTPVRPQESFPPFCPVQSTPQAPLHNPSDSAYHPLPGYAPPPLLPWQHQVNPPQTNAAYPVNYSYTQGFYPPSLPHDLHELHGNQGPMEPSQQPANGDTALGLRSSRLPGSLEGSASANMANANMVNVNGGQAHMISAVGFGHSNQENLMLLVDPPLDKPIVVNVPKSGSGPGSPALYSPVSHSSGPDNSLASFYMSHHNPANHSTPFVPPECLSVGCGPEDEWDDSEEFRHQFRGQRRGYRGRGRNPYRSRSYNNQYSNSQRGRGRH